MTTTDPRTESARTTATDFFERLNAGDVAGAAALVADDLINHAAIPEAQGRDGFERIQAKLRLAMPDARGKLEDVIAEGDRVMCRLTVTGTQTGPMTFARWPLPATGRAVSVEHIHVVRVAGGKIVEHWSCIDAFAMIRQLGMTVAPAA